MGYSPWAPKESDMTERLTNTYGALPSFSVNVKLLQQTHTDTHAQILGYRWLIHRPNESKFLSLGPGHLISLSSLRGF